MLVVVIGALGHHLLRYPLLLVLYNIVKWSVCVSVSVSMSVCVCLSVCVCAHMRAFCMCVFWVYECEDCKHHIITDVQVMFHAGGLLDQTPQQWFPSNSLSH